MEDNKKVIMAIGGHVGDMELTARRCIGDNGA